MLNSESFTTDLLIRSNSEIISSITNYSAEYFEVTSDFPILAYEPITKFE